MGTAARRPGGRLRKDVLALLVVGAICGIAAATTALATTGAGVTPVLVAGNPSCAGQTKLEPVRSGSYGIAFGSEAGSITITVRDTSAGPVFDFATDTATHLVTVVVVKGGPDANVYGYGAGVAADTGLHAPLNGDKWYGLSHLCFGTALASTPTPVDVCPNIPGNQATIPPGMVKDGNGNCVTPPPPPTDVCPNIPGSQETIPPGMVKDGNGNCVTPPSPPSSPPSSPPASPSPAPPTDVCPNIPGNQATIPPGMVKNGNGDCVTPPGAVPPSVDLAVVKVDTPDPVSVGRSVRYEITVRNNGPVTATGVVMTDTLPVGVAIVSARPTQGSCSTANRTITCKLLALAPGSKATVRVVARALTAGVIVNRARVAGDQQDSRPGNNDATATTRVVAPFQPPAAVCDSVTVGRRTVVVGRRVTLRVVVKANGRALAGERVRVRGAGIDASARTNRRGVAVVSVRAQRPGVISIRVSGEPCSRRIGAIGGEQPSLTG